MKPSYQVGEPLAQSIVEAAKAVIGYDVNYMNPDGRIIASTDTQRIGTFHEAGLRVLERGLPMEIEAENAYLGTRQGINYPVVMDGQQFGVIGISGDPEECRAFGFLLTKLTEVLIREHMQLLEKQSSEELQQR